MATCHIRSTDEKRGRSRMDGLFSMRNTMYQRQFIGHGDKTTSGGDVRVPPNTIFIGTPPRWRCCDGDPVYCAACKTMGVTKCVQPFRPSTGTDGRQFNLDGDLCICKCPTPPRLIASITNNCMSFENSELASMPGASGWLAYAGHAEAITRYDQFFEVVDKATGQPASDFSYGMKTNAGEHHDTLYDDGTTAKAYAEQPQNIELSYLLQTQMGIRS